MFCSAYSRGLASGQFCRKYLICRGFLYFHSFRPNLYQWSALPLSYGSMPGIHRRIGPKGPQQAGRFLPQAPRWRKHAVSQKDPETARKRHRVPMACLSWQAPAQSGSSSSRKAITALARPIRDLEFCHFAGCTVCSDNSGAKSRDRSTVKGLLLGQAPVHIFAHRRFLADDGIKTGPR